MKPNSFSRRTLGLRLSLLSVMAASFNSLSQDIDPIELRKLNSSPWPTDHLPLTAALSGDRLVVLDEAGGVRVVNITDPTSPSFGPRWKGPNVPTLIAASGTRVYVGNASDGLDILESDAQLTLAQVGHHQPTAPLLAIEAITNRICLAVGSIERNGLDTFVDCIDVSQPARPTRLGLIPLPFEVSVTGLQLIGDRLYVFASATYGFNLADPAAPSREVLALFRVVNGVGRARVRVAGRQIFELDYSRFSGGLAAYTFFEGAGLPIWEGGWQTAGNAPDFWVTDSLLAVADQPFSFANQLPPVLDVAQVVPGEAPVRTARWVFDPADGAARFVRIENETIWFGTTKQLVAFNVKRLPAFVGRPALIGTGLNLHWNATAAGMVLEWTTSLSSPGWHAIPESTTKDSITVPLDDAPMRFFRLVRP